jgi:pimeloyl-ACP methyl ester carboxylesterase
VTTRTTGLPGSGRLVELPDADLQVYETGPRSAPPLVLVHGFLTWSLTWRHLHPVLAETHRVVMVDLPGCGRSPGPRRRQWTATHACRLLAALFDAMELDAPTLVGSQLGGSLAAWFTVEHPGRVRRLVVMAAGVLGETTSNLALYRTLAAPIVGPLFARAFPHRPFARRWAWAHGRQHPPDPEVVAEYHRHLRERGAVMARFGLGVRHSYGPSFDALAGPLRAVAVPTLLIYGAEDRLVPPTTGRRFAELVPHARLVLLPGCGDFPQEEAPAAVLSALSDFLPSDDGVPNDDGVPGDDGT